MIFKRTSGGLQFPTKLRMGNTSNPGYWPKSAVWRRTSYEVYAYFVLLLVCSSFGAFAAELVGHTTVIDGTLQKKEADPPMGH